MFYLRNIGFPSNPSNVSCYENATFCDCKDDNGNEWIVPFNEIGTQECPNGFVGISRCLETFDITTNNIWRDFKTLTDLF